MCGEESIKLPLGPGGSSVGAVLSSLWARPSQPPFLSPLSTSSCFLPGLPCVCEGWWLWKALQLRSRKEETSYWIFVQVYRQEVQAGFRFLSRLLSISRGWGETPRDETAATTVITEASRYSARRVAGPAVSAWQFSSLAGVLFHKVPTNTASVKSEAPFLGNTGELPVGLWLHFPQPVNS